MKSLVSFPLLALLLSNLAQAYTGHGNSEAIVEFFHTVELPRGTRPSIPAARAAIANQVHHIFGPISFGDLLGAPRIDDEAALFGRPPFIPAPFNPQFPAANRLANQLVTPIATVLGFIPSGGKTLVQYSYRGPMVFANGPRTSVRLTMPNEPSTIHATSTLPSGKNPCTDETFQSLGDFFYFWSPDHEKCKGVLREPEHYQVKEAKIIRLPNEQISYPEYPKLLDQNRDILVTLIMGKDVPSRFKNPFKMRGRRDDLNAENFRLISQRIEQPRTFAREVWSVPKTKAFLGGIQLNPFPFVVEYTHVYNNERARRLIIRMVFTNADIGIKNSVGMHKFFEHSIEQGAVTIYDGHSGLGGNLDLTAMKEAARTRFEFDLPKKRYQIYFFNSCTSYAYYNDMFFDKKKSAEDPKGSKFLDILATGLETGFDSSVKTNMALVEAIHLWALKGHHTSYQTLAQRMEAENLFGVNGDEDNPKVPMFGPADAVPPPLPPGAEPPPEPVGFEPGNGHIPEYPALAIPGLNNAG